MPPSPVSLPSGWVFIEVSALYIGPCEARRRAIRALSYLAGRLEITRVLRFPIGIVDDAMKIPRSNVRADPDLASLKNDNPHAAGLGLLLC